MIYKTEVITKEVNKDTLLSKYRMPDVVLEACKLCPDYGRVWSCPPGVPDPYEYLAPYSNAVLIGTKVIYENDVRERVKTAEEAQKIRDISYEPVKKQVHACLLEYEKHNPGSISLCAGRCTLCEECTRITGEPCRMPDKMRYSITSFGFDFSRLTEDFFHTPLLWERDGLPEYDIAIWAVFF